MSIKARQVAGVTSLVVLIVAVLSALHMAAVARLSLQETASRGELLARSIFQRAAAVVPPVQDPDAAYSALQKDGGIRSLLESSIAYSKNVTYAAIVDTKGVAVVHSFPALEGKPMPEQQELHWITDAGPIEELRSVYSDPRFEFRHRLRRGAHRFGSIRTGACRLLVRTELLQAFDAACALLPGFRGDAHGQLDRMAPAEHPARQLVERTLASQTGQGPVSVVIDESGAPSSAGDPESAEPHAERLLVTHAIDDANGKFV